MKFSKIKSIIFPGTTEFRHTHNETTAVVAKSRKRTWSLMLTIQVRVGGFKTEDEAMTHAKRQAARIEKFCALIRQK